MRDLEYEAFRRQRAARRIVRDAEGLTLGGLRLIRRDNAEEGVVVVLDDAEQARVMERIVEVMQDRAAAGMED
ncbi:MAG: hypothetical protein KA745_00160 [Gemmatimonadales bacterium]|nr:hypothetical protein [Gemmatimonadales bacterium]